MVGPPACLVLPSNGVAIDFICMHNRRAVIGNEMESELQMCMH